eukprot:gnl/Chilomastix_cuspidata/5477.p1 GENE.gnl/Chilomastix_cuspidata/5477~~gnl/Chilomastix_cuspidata/5477.p1  ORF type:complete len:176 (-),score=46.32 gnl/Chilomastix_cuspidata/5477:9-536(-)
MALLQDAEGVAALVSLFKIVDTEGTERISVEEFVDFFLSSFVDGPAPDELWELCIACTAGTGVLDFVAFAAALELCGVAAAVRAGAELLDLDGLGVPRAAPPDVLALWARFGLADRDDDGVLSFNEAAHAVARAHPALGIGPRDVKRALAESGTPRDRVTFADFICICPPLPPPE